jgi:hypothetical protein
MVPWSFEFNSDTNRLISVVIPRNIESFADCALTLALYSGLQKYDDIMCIPSTEDLDVNVKVLSDNRVPFNYFLGATVALKKMKTPRYINMSGTQGQGYKFASLKHIFETNKSLVPFLRSIGKSPEVALFGKVWATTASSDQRRMISLFRKLCEMIEYHVPRVDTWFKPYEALISSTWVKEPSFLPSGLLSLEESNLLRELDPDAFQAWNEWKRMCKTPPGVQHVVDYPFLSKRWANCAMRANEIISLRASTLRSLSKADQRRLSKSPLEMRIGAIKRSRYFQAWQPYRFVGVKLSLPNQSDEEDDLAFVERCESVMLSLTNKLTHSDNVKDVLWTLMLNVLGNLLAHEE